MKIKLSEIQLEEIRSWVEIGVNSKHDELKRLENAIERGQKVLSYLNDAEAKAEHSTD